MKRQWFALFGSIFLLALMFLRPSTAYALSSASAACQGKNLEVSWSGASGGGVHIAGSGPSLSSGVNVSGTNGSTTFGGPGTWTGVSVEDTSDYVILGDFTCGSSSSGTGGGSSSDDDDDDSPPDDRINPNGSAPVAIYCRSDGIHVFSIDRFGQGRLAFIATNNEINAVGIPTVNTLIDSGAGIGLFRLTSGEFQVNTARFASEQPKVLARETGGQVIHVVQRGENMFRIAIRYRTTVAAIAAANGITNPALIFVGQRLIIPVGNAVPGSAPGTNPANPPAPSFAGIGAGYVFIFRGC